MPVKDGGIGAKPTKDRFNETDHVQPGQRRRSEQTEQVLEEAGSVFGTRGQTVARFALVQLLAGFAAQLRFADPVEREQRALQPPQFPQCGGHPVLPRIGRELAHDKRRRDRAGADRGDDAQDVRPVRPDEGDVNAAGDHRLKRRIGGWLAEAVEPTMLEIRDARRELEAKQAAQREDMVGIAAAIGVVPSRRNLTLVIEQCVPHAQRLARGRRDQLRIEPRVAVGEVGVDLEAGSLAVVGI